MDILGLRGRRRARPGEAPDPRLAVLRFSALLDRRLQLYGVGFIVGAAAFATHPHLHVVSILTVYGVIWVAEAIRSGWRELRQIRLAREFAPWWTVRLVEPASAWQAGWPGAIIFGIVGYFYGARVAGAWLAVVSAPGLIQASVVRSAVARRERSLVDLYVEQSGDAVHAHSRGVPLNEDLSPPVRTSPAFGG